MRANSQPAQQDLFRTVVFTAAERSIFRRRKKMKVSEWAEQNIEVTTGSMPGPWRNEVTPYLTDVMDTWGLPYVREVVFCAAPQTSKTSAMHICLGYAADQTPGAAMMVMPDETLAKRISKRRIQPMFRHSATLSELISSNPNDFGLTSITLINGMSIDLAWANSPSALSAMPVEQIFLDEVDKYPATVGKESDPISLAAKRTRTYPWTSKLFIVSSPTIEQWFIWERLNLCHEIRDYYVPCLHCGTFQILEFENVKWPEDCRDHLKIESERLAWYECPHCHGRWNDMDRDRAVRAGHWEPREPVERPHSVGFHLPAFYSRFVSLSECAASFLKSHRDRAKLRDFYNGYLALPWKDYQVNRTVDRILALRDDRPRGVVPTDCAALLAAVDTQVMGFYYEIRAFGWGLEEESWQVREGWVETWDGLTRILYEDEYLDAAGNPHIIQGRIIDSGGDKTSQVYNYCRTKEGILCLKGQQRQRDQWHVTKIDHWPDGKVMIGGLRLYLINTTFYKDKLSNKLAIAPGDPGAWHLHRETTEEYGLHMTAEYKDDHDLWKCPPGKANHYWDTGVYLLALADIMMVPFWRRPGQAEPPQKPKHTQREAGGGRPSWFNRR